MKSLSADVSLRAELRRRGAVIAVAALVLLWSVAGIAQGLTIPVRASDGTIVGYIDVDESPDGTGVVGGFLSTYGDPETLAAAAEKCGEDHFNWFQVTTSDNMPPNGPDGKPLDPPYIDPPQGGYGPPDTQWADSQPWYWDEETPGPPDPPGYDPRYHREAQSQDNLLDYEDFPGGPPGTELEFVTWLVSLNADGSVHSYHGGFTWEWSADAPAGGGRRWLGPGSGYVSFDNTQPGLPPSLAWQYYGALAVPEPASCILAGLGFACLVVVAAVRRRRLT